MRPIVIGAAERDGVEAMLSFARANVYRPGPNVPPPGCDPRHVAEFPLGFRCVFSITQADDGVLFRHLSISVKAPTLCLPHPAAVELLGQAFGFEGDLASWLRGHQEEDRCVVVAQTLRPSPVSPTGKPS